MADLPRMTPGMAKILADVRRDGTRKYNGRARERIGKLEALGLVTVDWEMDIIMGGRTRWIITVTAAPEGGA